MPDLETTRLRLHALTVEEAEALEAGDLPLGWTYSPDYPMPDTRDGVALYLRHGDQAYGFHFAGRSPRTFWCISCWILTSRSIATEAGLPFGLGTFS